MPNNAKIIIAALYQFKACPDYVTQSGPLKAHCKQQGIKGTLILSREGINGTVSGTRAGINALKAYLMDDLHFTQMEYKESTFAQQPFYRMKVLSKPEIVTLGRPDISPNEQAGTYVSPEEWNDIIQQEDVTVIDVRNDYEVNIGSFQGAINPETKTFRDFPEFTQKALSPSQHKKVAMFCTGGIRCEKASAFMLKAGFKAVYHLKGGILAYLAAIPKEKSLWKGECFVFDQRVTVKENVEPGAYTLCFGCRMPVSEAEKASPHYEEGIACPACYDTLTEEKRGRIAERHRQVLLAQEKGYSHLG